MKTAAESALSEAAKKLSSKLKALAIDAAPVSDYTRRYYKDYLRKLDYALQSIIHLLTEGLKETGKDLHDVSIIDHGGGIGIISFLAAEAGFKEVIYSDIFEPASKDAKTLAKILNLRITQFHSGDMTSLKDSLESNSLKADLLVSRNVIEHIYDLDKFMNELCAIPAREKLAIAFSTTANCHNPLTVLYTEHLQKKAEEKGLKGKWEKETDRGIPFIEVRRKIIRENFAQLKDEEIDMLAGKTRGFNEEDIIEATSQYTVSGKIPVPASRRNTCDPMTGNRSENLLPTSVYKELFNRYGFSFTISYGQYNEQYASRLINLITPALNFAIRRNRMLALHLSPFLIFSGRKK